MVVARSIFDVVLCWFFEATGYRSHNRKVEHLMKLAFQSLGFQASGAHAGLRGCMAQEMVRRIGQECQGAVPLAA